MISEAVQAARGTGAESPRGDFCEPQVVPTEAPTPAFAKTSQSAGAATGFQHSNLRVQTLLMRGVAVS